jgi:hypothetical protein
MSENEIEIKLHVIKDLDTFLKTIDDDKKIFIVIGENCAECDSFLYSIADCVDKYDAEYIEIIYLSNDLDEELGEYIVSKLNVYIPFFISNKKIFFDMDILKLRDMFCEEKYKKKKRKIFKQ